jgi:hypothetical protein
MNAAYRFPVTEALANLVQANPMPGNELFHPDFRRGDKIAGLGIACLAGSAAGWEDTLCFKDFKAGFGDKIGRKQRRIGFEVATVIKKTPDRPDNPGAFLEQFQIHRFLYHKDRRTVQRCQ